MTFITSTSDAEATSSLGERLAPLLPDGSILELISDLGGGKTTFVQGLARGLGVTEPVASPTFTLSRIYALSDGRELYHYDLYRLSGHDVVIAELAETAGRPGTVTAIEWPAVASSSLDRPRLRIEFVPTGPTERRISFTAIGEGYSTVGEGLSR